MQFLETKDPTGAPLFIPVGYTIAIGIGCVFAAYRESAKPQKDLMDMLTGGGGPPTFSKFPAMQAPQEIFLALPEEVRKEFIVITLSPEQINGIEGPGDDASPMQHKHFKIAQNEFFAVRACAIGGFGGFGGKGDGTHGMLHLVDGDRYGTVETPEQLKALAASVEY